MLDEVKVKATFFTTGDVAKAHPSAVEDVLAHGHELGCHGMSHTAFTELTPEKARWEIEESARILRGFGPVTSFRAPYLKFPDSFVGMLEENGFELDSSQAKYKLSYYRHPEPIRRDAPQGKLREGPTLHSNDARSLASLGMTRVRRIPASLTSSALRIPKLLREIYLRSLSEPLVLFVHPWEFVDLRHEKLRYDCRFRTGETALACVRVVLQSLQRRGAVFTPMRELPARTA
jgi:peptidoglycan/xylan/chitin deacetylase (PgdA/CDA1 family)